MKLLNTLLLSSTLVLFASCAHQNHNCCSGKTHSCQQGSCKKDKSCCEDKCGKCDGKNSCSTGKCAEKTA